MPLLPCDIEIKALQLCEKRHPREKDIVCKTLNAALAWCLLKTRCPSEADDLEDCCGAANSRSSNKKRSMGPPKAVPRRCLGAAAKLEACLERAAATEEEGQGEREKER